MADFDQAAFEQRVEQWLSEHSEWPEQQPFRRFLAAITLINLTRLQGEKLVAHWQSDPNRHAFAVYRMPCFFVTVADYADYSSIAYAAAVAAVADDDPTVAAAVAATADAATATATAYVARAARAAAYAAAYAATNFTHSSLSIDSLWQTLVEEAQPSVPELAAIRYAVQAGLAPLNDIDLDFLHDDLLQVFDHLATGSPLPKHINAYAKNIDAADRTTPKQLKAALFGPTEKAPVRALVVGAGGAGKTTLCQLLGGEDVAAYNAATTEISQQALSETATQYLKETHQTTPPKIILWDFAGQTQYYGLHRSFFSNRCLYVLVIDSRHPHNLEEWLQQIRDSLGGQASQALLAVNTYENCPSQINLPDLQRRFPELGINQESIVILNLAPYLGTTLSKQAIADDPQLQRLLTALDRIAGSVQTDMLPSTKQFLESIEEAVQSQPILRDKQLAELANDAGIDVRTPELKTESALSDETCAYIERLGLLMRITKKGTPTWISTAWLNEYGYRLLCALQAQEMTVSDWRYGPDELAALELNGKALFSVPSHCQKLLDTLHDTLLAAKPQESDLYLFPAILPCTDPPQLDQLYQEHQLYGTFCLHLDYMPDASFAQWLAGWIQSFALTAQDYSRYCAIVRQDGATIAIQWQSARKMMLFSLFTQQKPPTEADKTVFRQILTRVFTEINRANSILHHASDAQFLQDGQLSVEKEILDCLLGALEELAEKGWLRFYHYSMKEKGNTMANNTINNYGTMGNANVANEIKDVEQTSNQQISINPNEQQAYLAALDKLHEEIRTDNGQTLNLDNALAAYQKIHELVKTNALNQKQKSWLIALAEAAQKSAPLLTYGLALIQIASSIT